jgi:S1-C subfamily serine protease
MRRASAITRLLRPLRMQASLEQSSAHRRLNLHRHLTGEQGREDDQRRRSNSSAGVSAAAAAAVATVGLASRGGEDAASLSVSQLKSALAASGVSFQDCVERSELVQRLEAVQKILPFLSASPASAEAAKPERLSDEEGRVVRLFQTCSPSVVHIRTTALARSPFSQDLAEMPLGAGSGFIWDGDGHVVTNWHVVRSAEGATVTLSDNSTWNAVILGKEEDKDLCVLKLTSRAAGPVAGVGPLGARSRKPAPSDSGGRPLLRPISVGSSADLQVGQRVFAIGNPFGLDATLTAGIVSGLGRDIVSLTGRTIRDVIQSDAAINPGNSGGPLLDSSGRLIGVNTVIYSPSGAFAGVGFAIPADTVRRVVSSLIKHKGRSVKPGLGVHAASDAQTRTLGLPGVLVISVAHGSAAAAAGLRPTTQDELGSVALGDCIVKVGATPVAVVEDLLTAVEELEVGAQVPLTLWRDGVQRTVTATLGRRGER